MRMNPPPTLRRLLTRLVILAAVLPLTSLAARRLTDDTSLPVPLVHDTLVRFLPSDATVIELEASSQRGVLRFEARDPSRRFHGEVTARGTLVWLGVDPLFGPPRGSAATGPAPAVGGPDRQPLEVMAFGRERRGPNGTRTGRYVDALGNPLFTGDWRRAAGPSVLPSEIEGLSSAVAATLRRHVGPVPPLALRREWVLGSSVHVATWSSAHGVQEVAVLDDGQTLFLALPDDEPVPPEVARRFGGSAGIHALLFHGRALSSTATDYRPMILANGVALTPPRRLASR